MERIALQKLIEWNKNKRKKPLIVWGARQVGKTYLVDETFKDRITFRHAGLSQAEMDDNLFGRPIRLQLQAPSHFLRG